MHVSRKPTHFFALQRTSKEKVHVESFKKSFAEISEAMHRDSD